MQHNLNKTDKTFNPKDQGKTRRWYATTADTLETLQDIVNSKKAQPPHTETIPMRNRTQNSVGSARTSEKKSKMPVSTNAVHETQEADISSADKSDQVDSLN